MDTLIFALPAGVGFIVLGRWIYRNPTTLYVSSLSAVHENRFQNFVARAFATLLIFGGSFALVAAPASLVIHRAVPGTLLSVTAGVLGALFLRPAVMAAPRGTTAAAEAGTARRGAFLTRKGKLFLATMAAGALLSTAEGLSLPALGKGALWPDVAAVTILVTAVAMLCEMLLVK